VSGMTNASGQIGGLCVFQMLLDLSIVPHCRD